MTSPACSEADKAPAGVCWAAGSFMPPGERPALALRQFLNAWPQQVERDRERGGPATGTSAARRWTPRPRCGGTGYDRPNDAPLMVR